MPLARPSSFLVLASTLAIACGVGGSSRSDESKTKDAASRLFARDNLIAWCIVPFDSKKRSPEDRAEMLARVGFKHFAYDWRAEHVPTFDREVEALKRNGVALDAFWAPGELNDDSRRILDLLKRHGVKAQLWSLLDLGPVNAAPAEQEKRVQLAVSKLGPLAKEAKAIGCTVGLYNHGGWFGEPENQVAIIEALKKEGVDNVGMVYNLHHGHAHVDRFAAILKKIKPYLYAINLNGMDRDGEAHGRKILPLGQGALDLSLLKTIVDSGYTGPIGILGHTQDDAKERLRDNLDGLDWLVPQLSGKPAVEPRPKTRTPVPPSPSFDPAKVSALLNEARHEGSSRRGAAVFADPKFACANCHKIGQAGGELGPDLTTAGVCITPELIVESVLWPKRLVKEGYESITVACADGRVLQGYKVAETPKELTLRDAATGKNLTLLRNDIEDIKDSGTLMPDGLADAMTPDQRRDLIAFLTRLGRPGSPAPESLLHVAHAPTPFTYKRDPLHPEQWPSWQSHVNRERLYDFYVKEAEYFMKKSPVPSLLPQFPGLDGEVRGHWGNQDETTWVDDRWNQSDLGTVLSGVFRGAGVTVPKGICVRLGEKGQISTCFNPETLCYEALWKDGFLKFTPKRHGFLDGLILDGTPLPRPEGSKPAQPFVFHGFYRNGDRVIFSYKVGDVEMLDAPWVDAEGEFQRTVGPAKDLPQLASLTRGGPPRWPDTLKTKGTLGSGSPYAVDTIEVPFQNPWKALLFFAGVDFLPDGSAMLCTMQGDVWHVSGLDAGLTKVHWRRFASGLHQALGLVVVDGVPHVLGRDQITRLRDLDGNGEADFYECVSNIYETSPAGHDFVCGLERDAEGRFYTVSGKQGLIRITPGSSKLEVLATGFRNPDGLGLSPTGVITVPNSEGEWICASQVCEIRPGGHYGYLGPKDGKTPDLPLVYLPRGIDNSSGGQVWVNSDRWGPLRNQLIHLSYGAGAAYLVLRENVDGQPQGAAIPIGGELRSGAHRGRFNPVDGQLYVCGMAGWGTYTVDDGSFQRIRYTGAPVQIPVAFHAKQNGVLVTFSQKIDPALAERPASHFVQAWNYRYGAAYGSPEFSTRHPGVPGHDAFRVQSAHVLHDGKTLFLELPELQPVNQLHLHIKVDQGEPIDVYATVHKLDSPFTGFHDYRPVGKTIAAHPILRDLAATLNASPNPWKKRLKNARQLTIEARTNLTFSKATLEAKAGEPIRLTFTNPDVVPHNWALVKPGTLPKVGEQVNKMIADPDALAKRYLPRSDDVLAYTDIVAPSDSYWIEFTAPSEPGRYPYLCSFPGHWMVMNGVLVVK